MTPALGSIVSGFHLILQASARGPG